MADGPSVDELLVELDGLRRAMESRAVIEQAKGVLIGTLGCDADKAFDILVDQSKHENRKLRDIAEELVQSKMHVRR
jgi:AmiR/NasT family two-component response regulator